MDEEEATFVGGFTFAANRSDYDDRSLGEVEFSTPQYVRLGNLTKTPKIEAFDTSVHKMEAPKMEASGTKVKIEASGPTIKIEA